MPICKLCLKEKKLIEAHIFPAFIYKYIYDDENILTLMSFDKSVKDNHKNVKSETIFSGEYDKGILCKECDNNIIGNYETTSAQIISKIYSYYGFVKTAESKKKAINIGNVLKRLRNLYFVLSQRTLKRRKCHYNEFYKIDYIKFKKFFLSILFKTAISNREFSHYIKISDHLKILRSMLGSKNHIPEKVYPVIIQSFLHYSDIPKGLISAPILIKEKDYWCVKLLVPGLLITIFLNRVMDDKGKFFEYILKEDGVIKILHMQREEIYKYFSDFKFFEI